MKEAGGDIQRTDYPQGSAKASAKAISGGGGGVIAPPPYTSGVATGTLRALGDGTTVVTGTGAVAEVKVANPNADEQAVLDELRIKPALIADTHEMIAGPRGESKEETLTT